ncbi:chemotaxis protein CheW [Neosynechococcus sphagnicola sy1]|uniref:Chemotaxis protein CheW n=1 Tax=Neosynechococcus sphagnicola sy1 TaxID=1497020 RepID=A0A098TN98_9CYAN|nr:chemotaxis protein CheW [Neosynechococcus sphagnicola]KGF73769.1 chemotaxis protein CheW [Neosynechococcus sphagnicola sy1]
MSALSPLRFQRLQKHRAEATEQFVVFRLGQEWFALAIQVVQKVVPLGQVYGDPQGTGVSLTIYQDQELVVVDVGHRIFSNQGLASLPTTAGAAAAPQRYLLIVQNSQGGVVGLPIDSQPTLRRVAIAAVMPLSTTYLSQANIQCVSSLMIQAANQPPVFLLDPDQLSQPQQITALTR